jgi:hypothetical protein
MPEVDTKEPTTSFKLMKEELKALKRRARMERKAKRKAMKEAKLRAKLELKAQKQISKLGEAIEVPKVEEEKKVWKPQSTKTIAEIEAQVDRLKSERVLALRSRYLEKYGEELEVPEEYERMKISVEEKEEEEERVEKAVEEPREKVEAEKEKLELRPHREPEGKPEAELEVKRSFWSLKWWAKPRRGELRTGKKLMLNIANIIVWVIMFIPRLVVGLPYLAVKRWKTRRSNKAEVTKPVAPA